MTINYASKYSSKVDERFSKDSQALMAVSNDYEFTGVNTVNIYTIPVAAMTDYARTGASRYGSPAELQNTIQTVSLTKDRAFTFTIDRGNKIQTQMVMDAGKALARQLREVLIPEFDTRVFAVLAEAAMDNANYDETVLTKSNAYEYFLAAQESLGDNNVPDAGRIAFCSYKFANLLKQDSAFMRYSDMSQEMIIKGVVGEVDGTKIVKVPSSRLPWGTSFILVHPIAACAPKQLEDYKIHDNPPGISGWLVEGRMIYDSFVLNSKLKAVYFHGGGSGLRTVNVASVVGTTAANDSFITSTTELMGTNILMYKLSASAATAVTFGADLSAWTAFASGDEIACSTSGYITIAECTAGKLARGVGSCALVKKA